jgi:hypothetical protein
VTTQAVAVVAMDTVEAVVETLDVMHVLWIHMVVVVDLNLSKDVVAFNKEINIRVRTRPILLEEVVVEVGSVVDRLRLTTSAEEEEDPVMLVG